MTGANHGDGGWFGYRRDRLMGDVVSLGFTSVILFWLCVLTVAAGLWLGLAIS
jgi:hypothetical protein